MMLHEVKNNRDILDPRDIIILICTEANEMYPQSLLLCESIRTFAGKYSNIDIVAVSPRPELALNHSSQARLKDFDIDYVIEDLNQTGSEYGPINRIVASAWVEQNFNRNFVLALDTDTLFVDEPTFLDADVGVRPVDMKGATSSGYQDPQDNYWKLMCDFAGIDIDRLPIITTSIDKQRIRAAYNGGFSLIRRDQRIFSKAKEVFFRSFEANLRPFADFGCNITSSTGLLGQSISEFWTSGQAALSVAISSITNDVYIYDEKYNIPLNCLSSSLGSWSNEADFTPVMLHYHHLMKSSIPISLLQDVLRRVNCSDVQSRWINSRRVLFEKLTEAN